MTPYPDPADYYADSIYSVQDFGLSEAPAVDRPEWTPTPDHWRCTPAVACFWCIVRNLGYYGRTPTVAELERWGRWDPSPDPAHKYCAPHGACAGCWSRGRNWVDCFPPLSEEQIDAIRVLLAPVPTVDSMGRPE